MSENIETRRLRALIERPTRAYLWGQPYTITPRLIAHKFGDGQKLVCITPIMTRPNFFVARVDSRTRSVEDEVRDSPSGRCDGMLLHEIMDAQEDEYGSYHEDTLTDDERDFPIVNWDDGCSWGEPFPVEQWKPAPVPLTGRQRTRARRSKRGRR